MLRRLVHDLIINEINKGEKFLDIINNGFSEKVGKSNILQEMYEKQYSLDGFLEPTELIEKIGEIIDDLEIGREIFIQNGKKIFKNVTHRKADPSVFGMLTPLY